MDALIHSFSRSDYEPDSNPADYLEAEFFIPETGQPIQLHSEQRAVLKAMSERDDKGFFRYMTWVYSAIKKHGKTAIGAGMALWQAERIPNGEIYIVGNDLKQADNRMNQAIRYCVNHNPRMKNWRVVRNTIYLPNGTRIEAVPVDPTGEAGANPTGIFWTEAWGATQRKHELMWTELVLSPTRQGETFKFIESYAGYEGESAILERLYMRGVKKGNAHPAAEELYTNGSLIVYWCTRRIMDWQKGPEAAKYYRQEAIEKTPDEFRRQHKNEWVTSENVFVSPEQWAACQHKPTPMHPRAPIVIALDAGIVNDSFGIVATSRNGDTVEVRYSQRWLPPKNGQIAFDEPKKEVRRLFKTYHVVGIVYDPWQLEHMQQELRQEGIGPWYSMPQGQRSIADKHLYDLILNGQLVAHPAHEHLTEHILNANSKITGDEGRIRLIKRRDEDKIDLAVALSMAAYETIQRVPYIKPRKED